MLPGAATMSKPAWQDGRRYEQYKEKETKMAHL
jgi:hypothetical protein